MNDIKWIIRDSHQQMNEPIQAKGTMFQRNVHGAWAFEIIKGANDLGLKGLAVKEVISEEGWSDDHNQWETRIGLRYYNEEEGE